MRFLVINGPNLNLLGIREKSIYGEKSYEELKEFINESAKANKVQCDEYQSNHEGAIIDKIQAAYNVYDGIIINPAAYTHTSVAIADALKAVNIPYCEVHLSDVEQREDFRKISFVRDAAVATVSGLGFMGYSEAIKKLKLYINQNA